MTEKIAPLHANEISKRYEKFTALEKASLELHPGEIFGLIGLNGAGKTTLIKSILQLAVDYEGHIQIFGQPAIEVSSRRNLAYLPEKFQPSKYLTGLEYLDLSLSYYGEKLNRSMAEETAVALDFPAEKLVQKIASYSKGTAQKVGLIAAFLLERPLLILDEPMSGLDPLARIRLKTKMKAYRDAGNTIFFSSHILSDIDEICDRMAILHDGKMRYCGTPGEFKHNFPAGNLENSFLSAIAA